MDVTLKEKQGTGCFKGVSRHRYPSVSPTVICATSGGADNSTQQAVFAYVLALII